MGFIQGSENIREVLCQTHKICFACGNSCGIPADRIQYLVFGRGFTFNAQRDHSVTYISRTPGDKTKIESKYRLPYETGFSLTERQSDDADVISIYQSGEKKVTLWQTIIGDVHNFNTEYGTPEEVNINGCNGAFILENNGECGVVWTMDGYLFTLNGNIDKMSLLNLAKATNLEK